ncbi:MAG: D-inositol-3-phosphate glycosyltransferase [Candidatus Ordinivivax streblomastigis]|uniref:D-inositol-3-phosphate glycosyltransferase n=1 Tax=Candidatus Ordinivivax streblomastigis TaxID=2540710 RepID=A0A5M8P5E4_9BACT|nr:MAG: D-inositol-3-phosphate glycosyltransferase [Candidatus Ordinivivax streblomastigis]
MLSVLINAYACGPNYGSEPGMAWNWIVNLSKYCNIYVITESEFRDSIEEAVANLPQKDNVHFYYNPVSDKIRRMCRNQGDWRFYYYYRKWQKSTYRIALQIMDEYPIDIIHQLNMICFREPGYLWKIENIPYVWGPIGGIGQIPLNYIKNQGLQKKLFVILKNTINKIQIKYSQRVKEAFQHATILIGSTQKAVDTIEKYYPKKVILISETGCYIKENSVLNTKVENSDFNIIWVGRFLFSKKLDLALDTISKLKEINGLKFHIVGTGSEEEIIHYKQIAKQLGIQDLCIWHGLIPHSDVQKIMQTSDLLFFTSVAEGTPHVILEAIGNNLPVLCFNCCGQGDAVNDNVGDKIELTNPKQSIQEFADKIELFYRDRTILKEMSANCNVRQRELSWENKANQVVDLYKKILRSDQIQ